MKERPILFSAPMVRAILAGTKTQTRRCIKPVGNDGGFVLLDQGGDGFWPYRSDDGESSFHTEWRGGEPCYLNETPICCPYGQPGDRLWVREAWADVGTMDPGLIVYRADYPECVPIQYENVPPDSEITWKPSIHMFRRYSRITLEVVSIKVERLNDISDADAMAEGMAWDDSVYDYSRLWERLNGPGSWSANPWVWVVEFKRVAA